MRKELAKNDGQRKRFSATFSRLGTKINYKGYRDTTILLTTIVDLETNKKVADHVWFSFTKGFEVAGISERMTGVIVEFDARVKEYQKGFVNKRYGIDQRRSDYKLSNPTKINLKS